MYEDITYHHDTIADLEEEIKRVEDGDWVPDADDHLILLRMLVSAKRALERPAP